MRSLTVGISTIALVLIGSLGVTGSGRPQAAPKEARQGSSEGIAAWQQIYSVLTHPRCLNCHTAKNYPEQGDDRHPHQFNVVRGPEGRGVAGLSCATCHQGATTKAVGGPNCSDCHKGADLSATGVPGGHGWHLAPLSMAWQDRNDKALSSAQVCRVVTDRAKNENLSGQDLLKHHEKAELVLYAWEPGKRPDGTARSLPPLTHEQFVEATRRWVQAGTPCPQQ